MGGMHDEVRDRSAGASGRGSAADHGRGSVYRRHQPARAGPSSSCSARRTRMRRSPASTPAPPRRHRRARRVHRAELDAGSRIPASCRSRTATAATRADPSTRSSQDKAHYVGDNVAFVVAETMAQAKDAAELVEVDYEPLGGVADTAGALRRVQPRCTPSARQHRLRLAPRRRRRRPRPPSPRPRTSPSSS